MNYDHSFTGLESEAKMYLGLHHVASKFQVRYAAGYKTDVTNFTKTTWGRKQQVDLRTILGFMLVVT